MDMKNLILLTKDAMCRDYLSVYGHKKGQFEMPNLCELVKKGTLFTRYYTAAPSTVMAYYSIATGVFAHETDIQMYEKKHTIINGETIFTKAKKKGFEENHIIWPTGWETLPSYYDYFKEEVSIHTLDNIKAAVGIYRKGIEVVNDDDNLANRTLARVEAEINSILSSGRSVFLWLHLPHVLNGRTGYGSDLDLFDRYIGMIRKHFDDDCIIVSADHGNMNGVHGKLAYGFDVHDNAIRIPLITPRINGMSVCDTLLSSVDLSEILFEKKVIQREFIYSDTAYRAQKHRKLAIIYKHYKYVYNKKTDSEELYDLDYDPMENLSLMDTTFYDPDRKITLDVRDDYYYPEWDKLPLIKKIFSKEKNRIWKNGDFAIVAKSNAKDILRPLYLRWLRLVHNM